MKGVLEVSETLKKDAMRRMRLGFATMRGDPVEDAGQDAADFASTVNRTFVGSGGVTVNADAVIAYSKQVAPWREEFCGAETMGKVFTVIWSNDFPVQSAGDAATMGLQKSALVIEATEQYERGPAALHSPRKVTHGEFVSMLTAEMPRERPRVLLGDRMYREEDARLLEGFDEIGLSREEGLALLAKAEEILGNASFPAVDIVPIIARDSEEGKAYLTLRLMVDADLEKAIELDFLLTDGLVAAFPRLPERLSFVVYEKEAPTS